MSSHVTEILNKLKASGIEGFEGLIAELLEDLTGRHFLIAKSGSQEGRDISSSNTQSNVIAVECKRYKDTSELNERELLGEITQAKSNILDLDLWILVTTRDVSSQVFESLREKCFKDGLDFLAIADGDGRPSSLEVLCANSPNIVINFFENIFSTQEIQKLQPQNIIYSEDIQKLQDHLTQIANHSKFKQKLQDLQLRLLSPLIGYENWRISQNQKFLENIKSDIKSRSNFKQILNVKDENIKIIKRNNFNTKLDEWFLNWKNKKFVILGEEGDGKTWGLAHWLGEKIEQSESFPPVIFLTSSQISSNDNDPYALIYNVINRLFKLSEQHCQKRLEGWLKRPLDDYPLFILVLDGINERYDNTFWRDLLTKLSDTPWINNIGIVITCRTKYWKDNFSIEYLNFHDFTIEPYNDDELREALKTYSLNHSDINDEVLPLIRKPRYFDLMVKHQNQMSESGDFTIARLIYEDWKDRFNRKESTQLNDKEFQRLIQDLAEKIILKPSQENYITKKDIEDNLLLINNKVEIFNNLKTSGILEEYLGNKYKVKADFLPYGFGLFLVSILKEKHKTNITNLQEILSQWLEPLAEMDIKAEICHFASFIALNDPSCSHDINVLLLSTWINSQNPSLDRENDFIKYLHLSPPSYIKLAENIWSETCYNSWGQELLMRAFLKWKDNQPVLVELYPALEKWLGFINPNGFPNQRNLGEKDHQVRQNIRERLGCDLKIGDFPFYGYHLTIVEDDGLLQLGRFALGLISCLPRKNCIKAIVTGCLAEVIMGFPQRYDLLAWIIRSSSCSLWTEITSIIEQPQNFNTHHRIFLEVVHYLLTFEGSFEAYTFQQTLPSDLFPRNPWEQKHKDDPCTSSLAWNKEECEECIKRDDLEPSLIASRIQSHSINPDLKVPDNLKSRLEPLLDEILIDSIWSNQYQNQSEILFERYEPAFYLCSPEIIANFVRKIIQRIAKRDEISLRQLCFQILQHTIILQEEDQNYIEQAWQKFSKKITGEDILDRIAESILFQLMFQSKFKAITEPEIILNKISEYTDEKSLQRFLWFISINKENLSSENIVQYIYPILENKNSLTRALILEILYIFQDSKSIKNFIDSSWQWSSKYCDLENHWGSLLLMEYGQNLSFSNLQQRIHPVYLGQAIYNRGMKDLEIEEYKETLYQYWDIIKNNMSELPVDFPYIEVSISGNEDLINLESIVLSEENFNRNIGFISPNLTWGGWHEKNSKKINDFANVDQSNQLRKDLGNIFKKTFEEQIEKGNYYFCRLISGFSGTVDILKKVIEHDPNILNLWLEPIGRERDKSLQKILHLSTTFYEILCLTLLKMEHNRAIELYHFLIRSDRKIKLKLSPSNINFLDYALFQGIHTKIIPEWRNKLESCHSDLELMEIVLVIQQSNQLDWLESYIKQKFENHSPFNFSLAITILGFIDNSNYSYEILTQYDNNQPPTWRKALVNLSLNRYQKNTWGKHWFKDFLHSTDSTLAWRSFRLFLRCVDRRFWLWKKQLIDKASSLRHVDSRLSFLEDNNDTIENAIKNNEKEFSNSFLGYQFNILNRQVFPWL